MNLNNIVIVSFDVFDTLLLRPYANPQDVWSVLEEEENAVGFAAERKKADAVAYRKLANSGGETSIEKIYDLIPQWKHLLQKEMDLERQVLRANPEILNLWNEIGEKGIRRIIVSDMYLPSDFIKSVLQENGFGDFDAFYLSRDYNARKVTGELFNIVVEKEHVKFEEIVHIGDNMHSDVKIPQRLGMQIHYYPKIIERLYKTCPFTRQINSRLSGALALGWHQFCIENPNHTYWNQLGFMLGGISGYLYVKWIVDTAKKNGKNHLMFVARDGYIWKKICDELFPDMKTDYFYAPRLTSIAILGAIGSDPFAVKARQKYINSHLVDVDIQKIKDDYISYMKHFIIDDKTVIIDGCSSGFSAQRLVEWTIGQKVDGYYLLSMSEKENVYSLYKTNLYSFQFQPLIEFLFGSPENPIIGVDENGPVYTKEVLSSEKFKMSVSCDIQEGVLACAKILNKENIKINGVGCVEFINLFMRNLTREDGNHLKKAKNATDVQQNHLKKIIYKPYRKIDLRIQFKKIIPNRIDVIINKNLFSIWFGQYGLKLLHKNISVKIDDYTT